MKVIKKGMKLITVVGNLKPSFFTNQYYLEQTIGYRLMM